MNLFFKTTCLIPLISLISCSNDLAANAPFSTLKDCDFCPEVIVLPSGTGLLGASEIDDPDHKAFELPQLTVEIAPFSIGKYEVTFAEYRTFLESTEHSLKESCYSKMRGTGGFDDIQGRTPLDPGYIQTDRFPVVCVTWSDAVAYTEWLSERTGFTFRLPTEAEWEYAARGGVNTSRFTTTGNDLDCSQARIAAPNMFSKICKFSADQTLDETGEIPSGRGLGPVEVGQYEANQFGLFDLHGNVSEWVAGTWSRSHSPEDKILNPLDDEDPLRILKGGSWGDSYHSARISARTGANGNNGSFGRGFRVVREIKN